ncbi:PP2C family protein-serine/threonine phosphatase [Actinophytocola sp. NPDC049390]|uniref:PP2C family protein-serine/threonine phosphatase n=1 Tax=Actinophytocola sp. NPDC049390 TaxID=3363894 RepID=UPI003791E51C
MPDGATLQQRSFAHAVRHARLPIDKLWLDYFALGGEAGPLEVEAYYHGLTELTAAQRDMLAHTVNEWLDELSGNHRATYSRIVRETRPRTPPLTALVDLLEDSELTPPDGLAAVAEKAAAALGVRLTIYLADYEQRALHPLPQDGTTTEGMSLGIETTLPGRVYQQVRMLTAEGDPPRLWVPLLDGAERLGVFAVEVDDVHDLYDPGLRAQCRWLAMLLGHLVTLASQFGDGFDRVRLRKRRSTAGELIWSLLPPLTAGVDSFVVSAVLEPRYDVGGDVFDYALSETTAALLILDAMGHDLHSGLIAATALAAHRAARHDGADLVEQTRAMDHAIADQFGRHSGFATAVLAELDLSTGRLRYVNAGHPPPLLMRGGKIGRTLTGGRRIPLGLGPTSLTVGEETLQTEDWLVLHTDGISEARDRTGRFFGEHRLVDFLRREAAAGHPPPETARRLINAVLTHQNGELQDDATVLLARWTSAGGLTS